MSSSSSTPSIPTICLPPAGDNDESLPSDEWVASLRSACTSVGFFYLEGHDISLGLLQDVFAQSKRLFDLPVEEKRRVSDKVMSRGYTAMEEETLDPAVQTKGDTKEGFYLSHNVPLTDPQYNPAKLLGPNVWPTPQLCPSWTLEECEDFRRVMETYFDAAQALGLRVVQSLALAIGLPRHYFDDSFRTLPLASIRLLHYAAEPSNVQDGVFGCGAHSDYGMITLLLTDENPGLQILSPQTGEWIDVPPRPDAFVVNLGDMLERWTNGLFRSTVHRVLTAPSGKERYSIPFFYDPHFDTQVQVLEVCCDNDTNPPKYPPTTSGQHLVEKYKQTHADFTPDGDRNEGERNKQ